MIPAVEALTRLQKGNLRFAADNSVHRGLIDEARRRQVLAGQEPFAVILGCSDSRAPAEIIFDQGIGDLFVIRVAGNIVAPSLIGSVEFAVEEFGTHLVVVLGHTNCGAVTATVDELERPSEIRSPNLRSIVDNIRPSVETLMETEPGHDREALIRSAVRANIRASAGHLQQESEILKQRIQDDRLLVVGAEYSLETGVVDFCHGLPENAFTE